MKTKKRKLSSGIRYGYGANNERICMGACMGRPNNLPDDTNEPVKLRMVALQWFDGDYDSGGAYWGNSRDGSRIYWAYGDSETTACQVFVRAKSRNDAKQLVRESLPKARFYV